MRLYRFIKPINFKALLYNLCQLLKLIAIILTVPFVVSLIAAEFNYSIIFAGLAGGTFLIGLSGRFVFDQNLEKKEALIITALAYLIFGFIGAFAFLPVTGFLNGFFESISGFTTTGLSVLNPNELPDTLLFFRAYSQWIGGAGIIVLTLVILIGPGTSAVKLYSSEFSEENLVGDAKNTGIIVLKIYSILTAAGFIIYVLAGVEFFDALLYVLSTISTGGFAPYSESTGHYNLPLFHIATIIFMIFGATSFSSFYRLTENGVKGFFDNMELKYLLGFLLFFSILFYAAWGFNPAKIISSVFHSTTALTTTGFTIDSTAELPVEVKIVKIFLMVTGGTSESTAGGIKLIRLILMVHLVRWMVLKLVLPGEAKIPVKAGSYTFGDKEIKSIFSYFSVYILLIFLSSIFFVFHGYDVFNAIFETTSALGTVGLSTGITSANLPEMLKVVLMIDMWAGRLEIFPLLALLYPKLWIPKGENK